MNSIIERIFKQVKEMVDEANKDESNPVKLSCNLAVVVREKVPEKEDENVYLLNIEGNEAPEMDLNKHVPDDGVFREEGTNLLSKLNPLPSFKSMEECGVALQNKRFSSGPKFSMPLIPSLSESSIDEGEFQSQPDQYNPDRQETISITHPIKKCSRIEKFLDEYEEQNKLGEGGFGCVYAGIRRADNKPVAIKHIPIRKVYYSPMKCGDKHYQEISEVALMAQAAGLLCENSVENPTVIGVIETFELKDEVIIVMEREPEAMDMIAFYKKRHREVSEKEAKIIFRQLVLASLRMQQNGVFHRDLKMENTLIHLNNGIPEVKIIDFGCGEFVTNQPFFSFCGTECYSPIECFTHEGYTAEPTTVWQIGAMLRTLYTHGRFTLERYLDGEDGFIKHVSRNCNDFMQWCLSLEQLDRPTLEELLKHPWLQ